MDLFFNQLKCIKGNDFRGDVVVRGTIATGNNKVYEVIWKHKSVAMKEIIMGDIAEIENEIQALQNLRRNQFVISIYDYMICETVKKDEFAQKTYVTYILMEKGEMCLTKYLEKLKDKQQYLPPADLVKILDMLLNAFVSLQNANIAHRDIKPENILVMEPFFLKVCDVGSSTRFEMNKSLSVVGTISFLSPELYEAQTDRIRCNPFKSDVFSLGLVLLYIITLQKWQVSKRQMVPTAVHKELVEEWLKLAKRISGNDLVITGALKKMLLFDPESRPDFLQLQDLVNSLKVEKLENIKVIKQAPEIKIVQTIDQTESKLNFAHVKTDQEFFPRQHSSSTLLVGEKKQRQKSTANLIVPQHQQQLNTPKRCNSRSMSKDKRDDTRCRSPRSANIMSQPSLRKLDVPKTGQKVSQFSQSTTLQRQKSAQKRSATDLSTLENFSTIRAQVESNPKIVVRLEDRSELILHEDQCVITDYELSKQLPTVKYLCLDDFVESRSYKKAAQISPLNQWVHLKVRKSLGGVINAECQKLETLIIEVFEENAVWLDSFSNPRKYPVLRTLEIYFKTSVHLLEKTLTIFLGLPALEDLTLSIAGQVNKDDHKLLFSRISKLQLKSLKIYLPNNNLDQIAAGQWVFSPALQSLHLDYSKSGISSVVLSLFSSIRTLKLKTLYLDITGCFSQTQQICPLFEYISTHPLKEFTLKLDDMHRFENILIQKMNQHLIKLTELDRLTFSFFNIKQFNVEFLTAILELFDKLAGQKCSSLSIGCDRVVDKQFIKNFQGHSKNLKGYKLKILPHNFLIQILFENSHHQVEKMLSKCNQGQAVKSSRLQVCIPCSVEHQQFIGSSVYVCQECAQTCHKKKTKHGEKKGKTHQNMQFQHQMIDQFTLEQRCMCSMIGRCKLENQKSCHRSRAMKQQLLYICDCLEGQSICKECRNDCHQSHQVTEMYVSKFNCQCQYPEQFND